MAVYSFQHGSGRKDAPVYDTHYKQAWVNFASDITTQGWANAPCSTYVLVICRCQTTFRMHMKGNCKRVAGQEKEKGVFKIWERLKLALTSRGGRRGGKNPPTKRRICQLVIVPGRLSSNMLYALLLWKMHAPPSSSVLSISCGLPRRYYATCMLITGAFFIHQAHLSSASAQRGCDSPDLTN